MGEEGLFFFSSKSQGRCNRLTNDKVKANHQKIKIWSTKKILENNYKTLYMGFFFKKKIISILP
jgi:hypothetical protein